MDMLSMQDIADLAGVSRPVVTVWRGRNAQSDTPIPDPVTDTDLRFDADQVAEWLRVTGRGNNANAADDVMIHSSLLDAAADRLDDSSLLLLLHAKIGEPLTGCPLEAVFPEIVTVGHENLLPAEAAFELMADAELTSQIDRLVEAGFSAAHVLDRVVSLPRLRDHAEMLSGPGARLLHAVVVELARNTTGLVVPYRTGGLMLVERAFRLFSEHEQPELGILDHLIDTAWQRAAWRSLDAAGATLRAVTTNDLLSTSLLIGQWTAATLSDSESFFDWVNDIAMELGAGGRALIVGPAALLVDPLNGPAERHRFDALIRGEHYVAPLRYVARLPKGMCRNGGRRRLALWVLAPTDGATLPTTVYADHTDHALDAAENDALAADVVAAVSGMTGKHSFLRSAPRSTPVVLRRHLLSWPVFDPIFEVKGAALSRVWDLAAQCDARMVDDIDVAASSDDHLRMPIPWSSAIKGTARLMRIIKGARIANKDCLAAGSGTVAVIGADEVRGQAPVGARRIDRLILESAAPRAKLTEPGDVVFVPTGAPQAIVDQTGGCVVQAPARIARCLPKGASGLRLLPAVLAADIRAQNGTDTTSWTVRAIPLEASAALELSLGRAAVRRAELAAELATLDALEHELANGVAAGTLTAQLREVKAQGTSTHDPQKEDSAVWREHR